MYCMLNTHAGCAQNPAPSYYHVLPCMTMLTVQLTSIHSLCYLIHSDAQSFNYHESLWRNNTGLVCTQRIISHSCSHTSTHLSHHRQPQFSTIHVQTTCCLHILFNTIASCVTFIFCVTLSWCYHIMSHSCSPKTPTEKN